MATPETKPRIVPLDPPYGVEVARTLERMMPPGVEPLKLFRTVAHNRHILDKLRSTGAYLLNFGTLEPLDRELVIHRTCARCGSEYEWGVHVTVFGRPLGLSDEQIRATVAGSAEDPVWDERQSALLQLVDQLHEEAVVSEEFWQQLAERWSPPQLIELIALVGQYHCVSFLTNALQVELEAAGDRFPPDSSRRAAD